MKNHIRIFSGNTITTNRLAYLLDELGVATLIKDIQESGRLAGFGVLGNAVELYIFESDLEKAKPIIENFKKEISE